MKKSTEETPGKEIKARKTALRASKVVDYYIYNDTLKKLVKYSRRIESE